MILKFLKLKWPVILSLMAYGSPAAKTVICSEVEIWQIHLIPKTLNLHLVAVIQPLNVRQSFEGL